MDQEAFEPLGYATTHPSLNAPQAAPKKPTQPGASQPTCLSGQVASSGKADPSELKPLPPHALHALVLLA